MKWNINDFINIVCFLTSLRKINRRTSCRNPDGQRGLSPAQTPNTAVEMRWSPNVGLAMGGTALYWVPLSSQVPVPGPSCLLSRKAATGSNTFTSTQRALACRRHELPRVTRLQRQIPESTRVVSGSKGPSKIPYNLYHPEGERAGCRGRGVKEARNELGSRRGPHHPNWWAMIVPPTALVPAKVTLKEKRSLQMWLG